MVSPRLWLGGTVSRPRDLPLILRLAQIVWRCASGAPLRLISAGFAGDPTAWRRVFRTPERTGQRGAPRQIPWPQLHVGQGIKDRRGAIGMGRRLVPGTGAGIMAFRRTTPGCRVANTADLDRRNGPFRARVACLARRTRGLVRQVQPLAHGR